MKIYTYAHFYAANREILPVSRWEAFCRDTCTIEVFVPTSYSTRQWENCKSVNFLNIYLKRKHQKLMISKNVSAFGMTLMEWLQQTSITYWRRNSRTTLFKKAKLIQLKIPEEDATSVLCLWPREQEQFKVHIHTQFPFDLKTCFFCDIMESCMKWFCVAIH